MQRKSWKYQSRHTPRFDGMFCFITVPLAQWEVPEVNISEGDTEQICFIRTADSAQSYEIQVGVRGKGPRPATGM